MSDLPTVYTDDLLVVLEISAVEYFFGLFYSFSEEATLVFMFSLAGLAGLTEVALELPTFTNHMTELVTSETHYFLGATVHRVLEGQAIHTEEFLGAEGAIVANTLASEASDHTVEIAVLLRRLSENFLRLRFGFGIEFPQLAYEVGGLAAFAEALTQHVVEVDGLVLGLFVDGSFALLHVERQSRRQLLEQLL